MEGLAHVERHPLPWRGPLRTECGLTLPVDGAISAAQLLADVKKYGAKRVAFMVCMTCMERADVHGPKRWRGPMTPASIVAREVDPWRSRGTEELDRELRAIGALVDRHRDEYEELLRQGEAADEWQKRKARKQKPAGEPG